MGMTGAGKEKEEAKQGWENQEFSLNGFEKEQDSSDPGEGSLRELKL